ncbi:MAG: hypothetical protein JO266_03635 [Acidobacteria bacterium]|nr:hypothetical protein [Acidobacteriota bacterium]
MGALSKSLDQVSEYSAEVFITSVGGTTTVRCDDFEDQITKATRHVTQ